MLAELYRLLHYTTAPPAATTSRLTGFLNDTQRELLTTPGIARLRDNVMPATAKANTARTALPPTVSRINAITDRLNNQKLRQVPISELRLIDPSESFIGGFPVRYAVVGQVQVQIQPTHATGLWASSTSTADTSQTAYVESVTTGGYPYQDSKALSGQNRVQIGTAASRTDHIEVNKFYTSATIAGYVSLWNASAGGDELARIEPGNTFARYLAVEWHPIQTADVTEWVDYTRTIFDLVNGFDEPLLPDDFHQVLVIGALAKEYLFANDGRHQVAAKDYGTGVKALMSYVLNDGDRITSLRHLGIGFSRLGSMYPVERWR